MPKHRADNSRQTAIQGELGAVAGGAARFAFDAAGAFFSRPDKDVENDGLNIAETETLPAVSATRFIRINDSSGARWLALDGPKETPYRRQLASFLVLGRRVESFAWRDLKGRSLPGDVRIDYKLWKRCIDDLKYAGLFVSERRIGTRPRVDVRHCLTRLYAGIGLQSAPIVDLIPPG